MKKYKGKIIAAAVIVCVLVAAYFLGGNHAGSDISYKADISRTDTAKDSQADEPSEPQGSTEITSPTADMPPANTDRLKEAKHPVNPEPNQRKGSSEKVYEGSESYSMQQGMVIDLETGKDRYINAPVPEGMPVPVEPQDAVITDVAHSCTLSVRCDTILKNMKHLDKEKVELVPEDGVIFPATRVTFYEGESVFNLLLREMKKNRIHMEFEDTPIYNSAYIEGINNLYEFDCGELSGWMYKVNGWFPNYGCSRYRLQPGDVVEWVYTCDFGRDVGGYYSSGGEE